MDPHRRSALGLACLSMLLVCAPLNPSHAAKRKKKRSGVRAMQKRCNGGDQKACNNLGIRYLRGKGVEADPGRASELFASACAAAEPSGCLSLGLMHSTGAVSSPDPARAAALYATACSGGLQMACLKRGQVLYHAEGVTRDTLASAKLFDGACKSGIGKACRELALMVERGDGIKKSEARGERLHKKACRGGIATSCEVLRARRKPMMWRIESKPPSYIVGTGEVSAAIWDLPEVIRKAIDGCTTVTAEADFASVDLITRGRLLQLPKATSLRQLIGLKNYGVLQARVAIADATLDRLKPVQALAALRLRDRPVPKTMTNQIIERARRRGQKLAFLEAPSGPVKAKIALGDAVWANALRDAVVRPASLGKDHDAMLAAWREGDEVEYARLLLQVSYARHLTGMQSSLISNRLSEWMPVLKRQLRGGSACIVIGIEFLVGKRGMLARVRGRVPKLVRVVR